MVNLALQAKTADNITEGEILQKVLDQLPPQERMTVADMKLLAIVMATKSLSSFEGSESAIEKRERLEYITEALHLMNFALRKKESRVDRAAYHRVLDAVYGSTKAMTQRYIKRLKHAS